MLNKDLVEIGALERVSLGRVREAAPFLILLTFLAMVALLGGGSRNDIQSLVILRPVAALFLGYGLWRIKPDHLRRYRFLAAMGGATIALVALHLVPLPPSVWEGLPGRTVAREIDLAANIGAIWRPISLVPPLTVNALMALIIPAAVLVVMIELPREHRFILLPALIAFGLVSGFWGFLQAIGGSNGFLYFYEITNLGSAVGFFANRNHQATLLACLFPMLAAYAGVGVRSADQLRIRQFLAIGVGMILVPLILVTGSRAGVVCGIIGLASAPFLYHRPEALAPARRRAKKRDPRPIWAGAALASLILLSIVLSRAEALDRLLGKAHGPEVRFEIWGPIFDAARRYFPVGSGIGTFEPVYQVHEPTRILSWYFINHAHNEWLELLMTGGLPALLLLSIAILGYGMAAFRCFRAPLSARRGVIFGRLGAVMILILALAGTVDYPLRVPSLACVFVIAAVWLADGARASATNGQKELA